MSVWQAQREISAAEFVQWMAYFQLEPFGEWRADCRIAMLSCLIANIHRGKNQRHFNLSDFMPEFNRRPIQQSPTQMEAIFKQYARVHNKAHNKVHNNVHNKKPEKINGK